MEEIRQYLEEMAELKSKAIEGMVTVLQSCQQIFTSLMDRGVKAQSEDPSNPVIPQTLEHLAILNDQIKTALDEAKKFF